MPKEYKIKTGERLTIERGFLMKKIRLIYSGMPNENTFAISPLIIKGNNGFAPTIYYRFDAVMIKVLEFELEVLDVTPDYIVLGL